MRLAHSKLMGTIMQYQAEFLDYKPIFNETELECLSKYSSAYPLENFLQDHRTFEERSIDYAYVSSKIEGNQYSRRGATMLLKYGFTEGGKTLSDAQMLLNLRDTFINVALSPDMSIEEVLSEHYLRTIHSEVSGHLLKDSQRGAVRKQGVAIEGSDYIHLDNEFLLQDQLTVLLNTAKKISNPFEQAIYTHCNLAYLQYFADCNKRTARLMQTAVLVATKITPIFFRAESVYGYLNAVVNYYETGKYESYKDLFLNEYQYTIKHLLGQTPEQIEAQKLAVKSIRSRGR